jgi:hypothetical protein
LPEDSSESLVSKWLLSQNGCPHVLGVSGNLYVTNSLFYIHSLIFSNTHFFNYEMGKYKLNFPAGVYMDLVTL